MNGAKKMEHNVEITTKILKWNNVEITIKKTSLF